MYINDRSVEKALFDKTVLSETSNPKLIYNGNDKQIKNCLINELKSAHSFKWAVSYVNWNGLVHLKDAMLEKRKNSKILLTTEGFVTDPQSLEFLYENGFDVRVYQPSNNFVGFHLKSFLFHNDKNVNLIIGSSNISLRGICETNEMNAYMSSHENGLLIEQYINKFDELWTSPDSIVLTKEFIESYWLQHHKFKKIQKNLQKEFAKINKIKPNRMQLQGLEGLEQLRLDKENKALVIAATGTGKTFLSALDVKAWNPKKILFIVHSKTIKMQAENAYRIVFQDEKRIYNLKSGNLSKRQLESNDYFFATNHCANKLIEEKLIKSDFFDYVIIDECHKIGQNTKIYKNILNFYKPKFLLGMTATPERSDDPEFLYKTFQNKIALEVRLITALNEGLVCPFNYYAIDASDLVIDGINKNVELSAKEIIKQVKKLKFYGNKLSGLVFVPTIKLANEYAKSLTMLGYEANAITDEYIANEDDVDLVLRDLQDPNSNLKFIVAVDKFNEGVDIPNLNMVFFLRETDSKIIFLQQLGRGLRLNDDYDKYLTVVDFIQNYKKEYKIAEALIGTNNIDRDILRKHIVTNFESISPFMNVHFDEKTKTEIFRQISYGVTVKHVVNTNLSEYIKKFAHIPDLIKLHEASNDGEIVSLKEIHQINETIIGLFKDKYVEKYAIKNIDFHIDLLVWLLEFAFVGDPKDVAISMFESIVLDKKLSIDGPFIKEFLPSHSDFRKSYNRKKVMEKMAKKSNYGELFLQTDGYVEFNKELKKLIVDDNFLPIYEEYLILFKKMSIADFESSPTLFNNYKRSEFLKIYGAKDLLMNAVGERVDNIAKKIFCLVNVFEEVDEQNYPNMIINKTHFKYCFQNCKSYDAQKLKVDRVLKGELELILGVRINSKNNDSRFYCFGKAINLENAKVSYYDDGKKYSCEIIVELEQEIPEHIYDFNKVGMIN